MRDFDVMKGPFEQGRENDAYVQRVLGRYDLPTDATWDEVRPIAVRLLSRPGISKIGVSLVLGREYDPKTDTDITSIVAAEQNGEGRYSALLGTFVTEK